MVTQPIERNKILIRLENLADYYDDGASPQKVDFSNLCVALWQKANPGVEFSVISVQEMSLSGNMPLKDMLSRKI